MGAGACVGRGEVVAPAGLTELSIEVLRVVSAADAGCGGAYASEPAEVMQRALDGPLEKEGDQYPDGRKIAGRSHRL